MSLTRLRNDLESTDCFNRIQSQLAGERHRPLARTPAAQSRLLRVLVVDDERDTANLLARLVEIWGHEAHKAYDGAAALAAAARQTPDVLLLDIAMPDMDGFELAQRLRGEARSQNCFLIALSGYAETASQLQSREAGIDLVLLKPVDSTVLETLLDLERRRLGRSRRKADRAGASSRVPAAGGLANDMREVIPGRGPAASVT